MVSAGHVTSAHSLANYALTDIITTAAGKPPGTEDDGHEFATSLVEQTRLVTQRMNVALYRNVDYINNKLSLHIGSALFNGFTFWMIGSSVASQQEVLFAIFNFIFVAPGVINQLQPLFVSILESPSMAANANNLFLDRETRHL